MEIKLYIVIIQELKILIIFHKLIIIIIKKTGLNGQYSYNKQIVINQTINRPKKYNRAFPSRYDNHSFYISK